MVHYEMTSSEMATSEMASSENAVLKWQEFENGLLKNGTFIENSI